MNMVNTRTKPIPIKATSSSIKKSSSTSSPQSSSSSASPQTSSSSANQSPATTIQNLVRSNSSRAAFSSAEPVGDVCKTSRSSKSASDVQGTSASAKASVAVTHSVSPQSTFCYGSSEQSSKLETTGTASSLTNQSSAVSNNSSQHHYHISSDILDDLASRFIINVPDDERNNLIRICFQIELAHWFYLDFFCINDEKKCGMKQFAMSLFHHIPFLRVHLPTIDKILDNWKQYKLTVPTYGAILLSEDLNYVLLVQSYWAKSSWGFPKGKVNENEDPVHCAAREVYEETGYDITHLIVSSDYIESVINDQYTRLYLVRNVPLKTLFMPRTRKEIKCCEWFLIDSLPTSKNDSHAKQNLGINANSFFMIMPFIKRLKKWVCDKRANCDNVPAQFHGNKFKFNGQFPNNSSTLNVTQASCKKADSKMSLKVISTSTVANQNTELGFMYQNAAQNSSNLSTLNKRQRHKSMGDLDGLVKSNQTINGFHQNNLTQATPTSSSIFSSNSSNNTMAISNFDPYEQREKAQKSNNRRPRLMSGTGFWKIAEANSAELSSDNMAAFPNRSSDGVNVEPFESVEENSLTSTKLPYSKSIKHYDSTKGIYHAYSRVKNTNDLQTNRKRVENPDILKENEANMNSKETTSRAIRSHQLGSNIARQSLDSGKVYGSIKTASQALNTSKNRLKPTQLSKATMNNLKRSAHFDSWRTFSFTENCIANVFC